MPIIGKQPLWSVGLRVLAILLCLGSVMFCFAFKRSEIQSEWGTGRATIACDRYRWKFHFELVTNATVEYLRETAGNGYPDSDAILVAYFDFAKIGFRWRRYTAPKYGQTSAFVLYGSSIYVILLSSMPLLWIVVRDTARKRQTSKRRRLGLCLTCGYDLRGSVDRCPECGKTRSE